MPLRRGHNSELWTLGIVALLAIAGGAVGLAVWTRSTASRVRAEAAAAEAAASKSALEQMRDAEKMARAADPEPPSEATAGRALELTRILGAALAAADTPERKGDLRRLLDSAAVEVESGRLRDEADAVAALRMTLSAGYRALGEHRLALGHLRAVLDDRTKALGEGHPDTISVRAAVEEEERAAAGAR